MSKRLVVFLTDPLAVFHAKGEIRTRYYNPANYFSEVHFLSPAARDIDAGKVQMLVGDATLVVHSLGPSYYGRAWLPVGPVATLLKRARPHVLRAYDPGIRGSLAVYWGKRTGVPSLVSVHSDLDEQRRHERRRIHLVRTIFERYALRRADAVMCVSGSVASYARRHGARSPVVIYNRVYAEEFEAPDRSQRSGVTVLSVGRLVPPKDQECLIRAMQGLDAKLVLIGDGERRQPLERLVSDLGMDQQVTFCRSVPHSKIPRYYRQADIFAVATHYEGFCIPVLEAMAAGLPVVASKIAPIAEIMGDTGFLAENEPGAFAITLRKLVTDAELRKETGRKAAARARTMEGRLMEERERDLYATLSG